MSEPVYVSRIDELLKLKSKMQGTDVTIKDVADYVGVSRQTIHAWMSERGVKVLPTAERQRKLERFFGVTWDNIWRLQHPDKEDPQLVAEPAR